MRKDDSVGVQTYTDSGINSSSAKINMMEVSSDIINIWQRNKGRVQSVS